MKRFIVLLLFGLPGVLAPAAAAASCSIPELQALQEKISHFPGSAIDIEALRAAIAFVGRECQSIKILVGDTIEPSKFRDAVVDLTAEAIRVIYVLQKQEQTVLVADGITLLRGLVTQINRAAAAGLWNQICYECHSLENQGTTEKPSLSFHYKYFACGDSNESLVRRGEEALKQAEKLAHVCVALAAGLPEAETHRSTIAKFCDLLESYGQPFVDLRASPYREEPEPLTEAEWVTMRRVRDYCNLIVQAWRFPAIVWHEAVVQAGGAAVAAAAAGGGGSGAQAADDAASMTSSSSFDSGPSSIDSEPNDDPIAAVQGGETGDVHSDSDEDSVDSGLRSSDVSKTGGTGES